jgi:Tfp pilus assembly protein PilF
MSAGKSSTSPAATGVPVDGRLQRLLRDGFDALARGDPQRAADCCRRALAQQQDLVPAHFLVGLVALELKERKTAIQAFGSVTRLQPDHAAAWVHLAKLFMTDGQVNRADAAVVEAEKHPIEDPQVLDLLGTVHSLMGNYDRARECYQAALAKQPEHLPFLVNSANNHVYLGDTAAAERVYLRVLDLSPEHPQAHFQLATARRARDDSHVRELQALLGRPRLAPRAEAFLAYALGKELEDLERWDDAFEAFARGARARRRTVEYDEQAEIAMYVALERIFDTDWLRGRGPGHDSRAPVFVLGQPRTGTTLIERIISSHSMVHSAGELQQFGLALRRLSGHEDPKRFSAALFEKAGDLDPRKVGTMYLETTRKLQGDTPRFVDKLPQNFLMLPLILAALPNAKIVHLTRNPMDACFASFKQLFADAYLHSYDQRETARNHARYRQLMATWRQRFPGRFFDISYEATVADLEPHARALLDFLELPWEDACLEFHRQSGAVATASAAQVREPAHTRSVGRWRRYSQQLQPMLETLEQAGVDPYA